MSKRQIPEVDVRLDRRIPSSFNHVLQYPAAHVRKLQAAVVNVEVELKVPSRYHAIYNQGGEGACVGFGMSLLMSTLNRRLYDAFWLYREAQIIDEWASTPPEEGTSLSAGFDILRTKGHREILGGKVLPENGKHGIIEVNRWIQTVDEARAALANKMPIVDGVNWYQGFYTPIAKRRRLRNGQMRTEYWIPEPDKWGRLAGGHCILRPAASDERSAFGWRNSWGTSYPWPVYISYESHDRLMREQGESGIVTDR